MSDAIDKGEAEKRLWKHVSHQQTGMLGVVGGKPHHFQPMTPFVENDDHHAIWFFTRDDTDLVGQINEGKAMFVVQSDKLQACIGGELTSVRDKARIDKFWNPVVAAWYPQGKDDPHLVLLRFDCDDAEVWMSEAGPVRFAIEIAKANLTGSRPDIGEKASINLN